MFGFFGGGNALIQSKKRRRGKRGGGGGGHHQGGWGQQQQGGWGGQQGGWGGQQQGGWGGQQQGGWGGQQQGGWGGQQQGGWGGQGGWGMGIHNQQNEQFWGNNLSGNDWVQEQKKRNDFGIIQPGNNIDIGQIIAQQITFIQPSPVQKKLEELKNTGQPFIDEDFPANEASLVGEYGMSSDWTSIEWKKISQVIDNPTIFNERPYPCDIKQGYLGDCYFLAGLAALAERPDRIFNLFLLQELNEQKYFSVKMLYKGKWMTIDMDEYVPMLYNKPAFSKCVGDSLWVVLLEKAWAKLYTSYKRIEAGYPEEAIHDLTGAPIRQITFKSSSFDKEKEWQYLLEASVREYSMVASSLPGSDTQKSMKGVVQGHAYTVLNCVNMNYNGGIQRLVELRNPWGKGEWTSKWSDNDSSWDYVPQEEKDRIGFKPNGDDGLFWMSYDDFITEFRALTVAEIDDEASYVYKSTKDKQLNGVYFHIDILEEGVYSFHVDKTPERIYPEKYQEIFRYPDAIFEIGRVEGDSVKKYQGLRSARRTLFKKETLSPGTYIAFVKIQYDPDFEDQYDVNLAVYSETPCNIQLASREEAVLYSGDPDVKWTGEDLSTNQPWNSQGNVQQNGNNNFSKGSGWGQQGGNSGWGQQQQGGDNGWGNQGGNQGAWGGQQGGNSGWGGQGGNQGAWGGQQQQGGWGGQQGGHQGGWGGQGGNQGGWGGQGNNGW